MKEFYSENVILAIYSCNYKLLSFYKMKIKGKGLSSLARMPTRVTKGSAGYDLYSAENIELTPHSANTFSTHVRFKIPKIILGNTKDPLSL